ncbi:hypothetical protein D3C79_1065010 [compost metagenome]
MRLFEPFYFSGVPLLHLANRIFYLHLKLVIFRICQLSDVFFATDVGFQIAIVSI